jgi:hypothetical protein
MLVSTSSALDGRKISPLGRVSASGIWRGAEGDADREAAVKALVREAEEHGADAVIDVRFETDAVCSADVCGVALTRMTASGLAVRFAA